MSLYDWSWWRRASRAFRKAHPLCAECERHGIVKGAAVVDHIKPHRENPNLFFDESNLQSLCARCHGAKSARERKTVTA